MPDEALPPAVKQFLRRQIRSIEQLEILLLVHGKPDRSWTTAEVYDVVRSSQTSIAARLEAFTAGGFLVRSEGPVPSFRYAPKDSLRAIVDETARAYQTWRVRVIEAIFAPEVDAAQSFADAFKVRKK